MTFSEMAPGNTPAERDSIKFANARAALEVIREVDPAGVLFSQSWTFLNEELWPPGDVKKYLDIFPDDALEVWELWDDQKASFGVAPMYRRFDYYSGKTWLLGFLHSYGGTTLLHGDLQGLIHRVQSAAADPRAQGCAGISVQPEALHHDHIYFDLLARLGWNPAGVTLEGFLSDYATRRYGASSAPTMVSALRELARSVYGSDDVTTPLYQRRILERAVHRERALAAIEHEDKYALTVAQRSRFLPHLQRALEIMLGEADTLGQSALYRNDVADVARQFLGDLFNLHLSALYTAFTQKRADAVSREQEELARIMDSQERLLSSSTKFLLGPLIERAEALPGAPPSIGRAIRDILSVWAGRILDYARRDYYELLRFYYRKRVEVFLEHVSKAARSGSWRIDDAALISRYEEIERAFVDEPFHVEPSELPAEGLAEGPVTTARDVLNEHGLSGEE